MSRYIERKPTFGEKFKDWFGKIFVVGVLLFVFIIFPIMAFASAGIVGLAAYVVILYILNKF